MANPGYIPPKPICLAKINGSWFTTNLPQQPRVFGWISYTTKLISTFSPEASALKTATRSSKGNGSVEGKDSMGRSWGLSNRGHGMVKSRYFLQRCFWETHPLDVKPQNKLILHLYTIWLCFAGIFLNERKVVPALEDQPAVFLVDLRMFKSMAVLRLMRYTCHTQ